jgi:hypothetical protein
MTEEQWDQNIQSLLSMIGTLRDQYVLRWMEIIKKNMGTHQNVDTGRMDALFFAFQFLCIGRVLSEKGIIHPTKEGEFGDALAAQVFGKFSVVEAKDIMDMFGLVGESPLMKYAHVTTKVWQIATGKRAENVDELDSEKFLLPSLLTAAKLEAETRRAAILCFSKINLFPEENEWCEKVIHANDFFDIVQFKRPN